MNDSTIPVIQHFASTVLAGPAGAWVRSLAVVEIDARIGGANGYELAPETRALFRQVSLGDGRDAVQIHAPFEKVARGAMREAGLNVPAATPVPPLRAADILLADPAVVRFVGTRRFGVIRPGAGVDPAYLMAQCALAFPGRRLVVLVGSRADRWRAALRRYLPDVGLSTGDSVYSGHHRVVVATPGAVGTVGLPETGIVLVTDPLKNLGPDPLEGVYPADPPDAPAGRRPAQMERLADNRGRRFALLPAERALSRLEAARLAQMFGTDELTVPRHGAVVRPVRVAWENLAGGPVPPAGADPVGVKRVGAWANPVLNRRAAGLAAALAAGDAEAVAARFPAVARGLDGHGSRRTLVLVEGLDHAAAIAAHLPGWPVASGDVPSGASFTGAGPGVIATAAGAARHPVGPVDAVVRADLGVGPPPLPLPGFLASADPDPRPLLVVDFEARSHPLLRRWSGGRRKAYRAAGWADAGADADADADAAALALFIARTEARRAVG